MQKARPVSLGGQMLVGTPVKEQAYAGPTFQASPAPSSLPLPKFYSRSVPNAQIPASLQARMAGEKTPEKAGSSPETDTVEPAVPSRESQMSPLDMFFQADKAEKERTRSTGGMLSPEMAAARPRVPATEPRNFFPRSGKSVFLQELDGNDSDAMPSPKSMPPKSRPPFNERAHSSPGPGQELPDTQQHEAATRSLKDLLFNNIGSPAPNNSTPRAQPDVAAFSSPSPFNRPHTATPITPIPSHEQQTQHALHYGNRNLSPMFQAARQETPSRPSTLRQEVNRDSTPAILTNGAGSRTDATAFSREYLQSHVRGSSQVASMPQLPLQNTPGRPAQPASQRPASSSTPAPQQQQNGQQSIRSMEDDLRRMLNLNVLG